LGLACARDKLGARASREAARISVWRRFNSFIDIVTLSEKY
jgi:hypothetical protein